MKACLLLAFLLSPPLAAQEDSGAPEPEVAAGEAADVEASSTELSAGEEMAAELDAELDAELGDAPAPKRRARRKAKVTSTAEKPDQTKRMLLGVLALLLLWLLARSPSARGEDTSRRRRRSPISHEELGRAVFQVAKAADFLGYRDLFLNGPEAGRILGIDRAEAYLSQRNEEVLEDALAELGALMPPGSVFDGVKPVQGGMLGICTKGPTGTVAVLPVGTVTEVDGVQRLVYPPPSTDDEERFRRPRREATAS